MPTPKFSLTSLFYRTFSPTPYQSLVTEKYEKDRIPEIQAHVKHPTTTTSIYMRIKEKSLGYATAQKG